jgi:hypothetical protein
MINQGNSPGHEHVIANGQIAVTNQITAAHKGAAPNSYFAASALEIYVGMNDRVLSNRQMIARGIPDASPGDSGSPTDRDGAGTTAFQAEDSVYQIYQQTFQHNHVSSQPPHIWSFWRNFLLVQLWKNPSPAKQPFVQLAGVFCERNETASLIAKRFSAAVATARSGPTSISC